METTNKVAKEIAPKVIYNIKNTAEPGMFDIKEKAKWKAWKAKKGVP